MEQAASNPMDFSYLTAQGRLGVSGTTYEHYPDSLIMSRFTEFVPAFFLATSNQFMHLYPEHIDSRTVVASTVDRLQIMRSTYRCFHLEDNYYFIAFFGTMILVRLMPDGKYKYRVLWSLGVEEESADRLRRYAQYVQGYHGVHSFSMNGIEMWHHEDKFYLESPRVARKLRDIWKGYNAVLANQPILYKIRTEEQMKKLIFNAEKPKFKTLNEFKEFQKLMVEKTVESL